MVGRHVEDMASSARTPAVGASVPLGPAPRRTLFVFLLRPWPSRGAGVLPRPSLRCCFVNRHPAESRWLDAACEEEKHM